jgi:hypothetical protein
VGARSAIPEILDLFEAFEVSATWATVGFLFAKTRQELRGLSPTIQPEYIDPALSPYQEPVGEGEATDPLHFAPSLIESIAQRRRQEVGSHTFSHYYCLEEGQTLEAFRADLESAKAIADRRGIQLRSIVFPRNQFQPNYAGLLVEAGFVCYRGTERGWMYRPRATKGQKPHVRALRLLDSYLSLSGANLIRWDDLIEESGLCNVGSSRFLRPYVPHSRHLDPLRLGRIVTAIEAAAASRQIFHLWWHPHNFGVHTDENLAFLRAVLEAYAHCRGSCGMRSLAMADVAQIASASK